jgi:enediyne biosynthesis protein E4
MGLSICLVILSILLPTLLCTISGPHADEAAVAGIRFEDVTASAGLSLERAASRDKRYLIETTGGGVAFFDYNNDGWLDIYLTNCPTVDSFKAKRVFPNRLYRNNGDRTFTDVSERAGVDFRGWSMGVSVADYDGDGDLDLYLTNFGPNVLYRNNGDGTFSDVTSKAGVGDVRYSTSSGWADYDRDGDLDLFVANYVEMDIEKLPAFGQGRYCLYRSLQVLCGPNGLKGTGDSLYRNNGDGSFTDVSEAAGVSDPRGYYGLGVAWGDFDDDGDADLYVANDTNPNYLYWNQGNGVFREGGLLSGAAVDANGKARAGMGIAVGDYDNDGKLDLSVSNFSEEANALFHNRGSGMFSDQASTAGIATLTLPRLGWGTFFADFDNDGWKDLFVANGHVYPQVDSVDIGTRYRQPCLLFRNLGNAQFANVTPSAGTELNEPRAYRGAALGDFDNDGDLDILAMDLDGGPHLWENRTPGANSFLRVKAPIGSRVTIETQAGAQMDEIRASGSYQSACEPVAHFGLGRMQRVSRVRIRFPNNRTREFENVKSGEVLLAKP